MSEFEEQVRGSSGGLISRLNHGFASIAGWSFVHRWWVVLLALSLLAGSVGLDSKAEIDSSYEAYFDPDDSAYLAYETFRDDFGSDEVSYILSVSYTHLTLPTILLV